MPAEALASKGGRAFANMILTFESHHEDKQEFVTHGCSGMDKKNKAPRHWPLWGESTGDQWIPLTKGQ